MMPLGSVVTSASAISMKADTVLGSLPTSFAAWFTNKSVITRRRISDIPHSANRKLFEFNQNH